MAGNLTVGADRVVSVTYTLEVGGEQIESGTIEYLHGHQNIVPGLEAGLEGAELDAVLKVEVPAELGYGERMEENVQEVPREAFPGDLDIEPGMQFGARGPDGNAIPVWVTAVTASAVTVDMNHPLAGKTLVFDVAVVAVRAASAEELAHGHPHGPDGHGHGH